MSETQLANSNNQHTEEINNKTLLGFWVYLMTDLIMFAALFASYVALRNNTYGGPGGSELFSLSFVLVETLILLTSSFTCGLSMLGVYSGQKKQVLGWFLVTALLGVAFLTMEVYEFRHLILEGHGPQKSAFLSAFFSLIGMHGLHILSGVIWIFISLVMVYKKGLTSAIVSKLSRLSLFWHFLDIVWIFIFTIVYLFGVM
jgi:cytochrome o ubiquinol oxidase subunit 3